ncbi:LysR family transcriptional regulator [Candidatus Bipolaricaulota bacterium]|nr:LysR family transcriptional regulator [Candidatus Bipolaricaulota bacterium]
MDLKRLHYFLAVAEELHFGRAAERLQIKQPPLSRQIQNLEQELAVKLFDRTHRRVALTPSGLYLKAAASKLLAQADLIQHTVGLMQEGTAGFVRIGYVGSAMHAVVPALLRELHQRYPSIYPELFELDSDAQIRALHSGEIDIGFARTPIHAERLVMYPVLDETFSLVVPLGHRVAAASTLDLAALANEPFIGFSRSCAPGMADQILQICSDAGFSPRIVHSTSQLNTLLRLVESGLGYSIVPSSVRAGYDLNLAYIDLVDVPQRAQLAAIYDPQLVSGAVRTLLHLISRRDPTSAV